MDKDLIAKQEKENDGQTAYLYYDDLLGVYEAYGLSAYYTTMVADPFLSFSETLQMPVALFHRDQILFLRQSMTMVDHQQKDYYVFKLREALGRAGYEKWAQKEQKKHTEVIK